MKKILITGASGMLGSAVCKHFSQNDFFQIIACGKSENSFIDAEKYLTGDLTNQNFLDSLSNFEFDAVVHCAALTDIEKSESEPEIAFSINAKATENLVKQFPKSVFVYISTDSVFDGKTGNYSENAIPNPLNVYARTKLAGENMVAAANEKHYILRTNMYGFHRPLSRRSLFEWSYEQLSAGKKVGGFTNVVFNPLYVGQLAEVIEKLISKKPSFGIYNAVCNQPLSKFEFIRKIVDVFDFSEDLVMPVEINEMPVKSVRPLITFLNNEKLSNSFDDLDLSIDRGFRMLYADFSAFDI